MIFGKAADHFCAIRHYGRAANVLPVVTRRKQGMTNSFNFAKLRLWCARYRRAGS